MIEQAMIFALGFFVAGLLALLFLPAVQRRAARLSARRLEMQLPLSMEEIVAERDQLRAEFAVERRRIEQKLEAAGEAAAGHMGEIGRHTATINDLTGQLSNTREELRALGEAKEALHREMTEAEAALAAVQKALEDESGAHGATRESLDTLRGQHAALEQVTHEQRASLAGLETRAAALDLRIVALKHQKEELERNLQNKTSEAEVLLVERDLARTERDGLETKRATLQRRLDEEALRAADLRDQIEALRRRIEEADRARVAGEQTRDAAEQRRAEAARQLQEHENRIRTLQTAAAERHAAQVAEIATLGGQLETARREHASLQEVRRARENDAAKKLEAEIAKKRTAEAEWQARHEKQAAEIAALTAALENARQQHSATQQELGAREREAQTKLVDAQRSMRNAETEWRTRHEKQVAEIAALTAAVEDVRQQHSGTQEELGEREKRAEAKLLDAQSRARDAETEWQARHAQQQQQIAVLAAALEEARQQHATIQEDSREREAEAQSRLEAELQKAHDAEAEWQARHTSQRSEIAGLVAFLEEAQSEKQIAANGVSADDGGGPPDQSMSQREETALLRQAIADLGSEVVRIAGSLKESDTPDDGGPMPDIVGVRERRSRARAQS